MVSISNNRDILMQHAGTSDLPESCEPMVKSVSTVTCQRKRGMLRRPDFWSIQRDYYKKIINLWIAQKCNCLQLKAVAWYLLPGPFWAKRQVRMKCPWGEETKAFDGDQTLPILALPNRGWVKHAEMRCLPDCSSRPLSGITQVWKPIFSHPPRH